MEATWTYDRALDAHVLRVHGFRLMGANAIDRVLKSSDGAHRYSLYKKVLFPLVAQAGRPAFKGRWGVVFVRRYGGNQKLWDEGDNDGRAFKPVRDALKLAGVVVDDDKRYLAECHYRQTKKGSKNDPDWLVIVKDAGALTR